MISQIQKLLEIFFGFLFSTNFIIILIISIVLYHFFRFIIRDNSYKKSYNNFKEIEKVKLEDLRETPLVNIIVPAWKEGEIFKGCLLKLKKLRYPYLKVIVNAGGSEETINIANSYKNDEKFTILYQKAGEGKLKAINDCLNYVTEGIVYLIDADIYLENKVFFQLLYSVLKGDEKIAISLIKPHNSIKNRDLVQYVFINRYPWFLRKFSKYTKSVSQNTIISYEVIKDIKEFSEGKLADDGHVIGSDLRKRGYKIFVMSNYMVESFNFPLKIKDYISQNLRWLENFLFTAYKEKKFNFIKFIGLVFISLYIYITPFLLFFNFNLFFIGIALILSMYFKKIRKILFFKSKNEKNSINLTVIFYIKMIYYIYVDLLMNFIAFFEFLFYRKAYKKRKNLLQIK